jgi:hypothetical protein
MLGAWAHMRKAELFEDAANRHFVQIDSKALLDDVLEINTSPTHDAVLGGVRFRFHNLLQLLFLFERELGFRARSFAADEPLGTLLVEAVHPVSQRLALHRSDLGGSLTAHPLEHRSKRQ